jgi:hypothetical protein
VPHTDGKGQIETRLHDVLGRQAGSQYADGTIAITTFGLLGRKFTEANQNGIWTRTYDALGQRLTELGPSYPAGLLLISLCHQPLRTVHLWGMTSNGTESRDKLFSFVNTLWGSYPGSRGRPSSSRKAALSSRGLRRGGTGSGSANCSRCRRRASSGDLLVSARMSDSGPVR